MPFPRHTVKKAAGTLIGTMPEHDYVKETETVMCCHCGAHWLWERAVIEAVGGELGFCSRCNGITCPRQSCQACVPTDQMLKNMEDGRPDYREYRPIVVGWEGDK